MKNRMRESRTFGSVRGEGRDALAYSENRPTPAIRVSYSRFRIADVERGWNARENGGSDCATRSKSIWKLQFPLDRLEARLVEPDPLAAVFQVGCATAT